jgi:hypothetical protein
MEVSGQPGRFTPRERAGTHWIGSCVGPRAVRDAVVKRKMILMMIMMIYDS